MSRETCPSLEGDLPPATGGDHPLAGGGPAPQASAVSTVSVPGQWLEGYAGVRLEGRGPTRSSRGRSPSPVLEGRGPLHSISEPKAHRFFHGLFASLPSRVLLDYRPAWSILGCAPIPGLETVRV